MLVSWLVRTCDITIQYCDSLSWTNCSTTWLTMEWKRWSVLVTEMFFIWVWFGGPDTCKASLPPPTISSHFMLNSLTALSTFLEMMVARGPLPPAVASSLCVCVCTYRGRGRSWKHLITHRTVLTVVLAVHVHPTAQYCVPTVVYVLQWLSYLQLLCSVTFLMQCTHVHLRRSRANLL